MLTKGAIGNLVNRYRAVLTKCNLINTFGSLAVASMLVLGGAGVAGAADLILTEDTAYANLRNAVKAATLTSSDNVSLTYTGTSGYYQAALAEPGNLDISVKNFTISSTSKGITAKGDDFITINAAENILIDATPGKEAALHLAKDGGSPAGKITLNAGGDVVLKAKGYAIHNNNDGIVDVIAGNNFDAISGSGISNNASGLLSIQAKNVNIESSVYYGIIAAGTGGITVSAEEDVVIKNKGSKGVIQNRYGDINVSAGRHTIIEGTICPFYEGAGDINVSFDKEGSSFTGSVVDGQGTTSLSFSGGAQANFNADSKIDALAADDAQLNILNGATVEVDELSGSSASATIGASANEDGTVSSGSLVAAKSDLEKFSVTYDGINADNFASKEAAAEFAKNSVQLGDENNESQTEVSGVIEGGDINGTITFDGKGNSTMGKSELMDAALQQASVATVSLDRILTNDVRKRLGDIRSDKNTTGVWMRWDGGKLKGDSGLTNNFNTIQIGGDTKAAKNCRIGFAGSFTHGDTDFSRGNGELEGFSFALYGTWMGENGMFADVVARLGKFSTEMNVDGDKGDMDNRVASLSAEYGWRFDLAQQFFIEPQVELAYTYVSSDDLQLGNNHYEFDNVDSLTGRAGVVAGWQLPEERGNVYARASVVQQFMGDAKISGTNGVADNVQEIDGEDTWLEYGIGANVKLTDSTYLWADVERTAGADVDEEWRGTVGIRYSF